MSQIRHRVRYFAYKALSLYFLFIQTIIHTYISEYTYMHIILSLNHYSYVRIIDSAAFAKHLHNFAMESQNRYYLSPEGGYGLGVKL